MGDKFFESDEEFVKQLMLVQNEERSVCIVVRNVLALWLDIPSTTITANRSPQAFHCDGWDNDEFVWHILYELKSDVIPDDFPDLFPCSISLLRRKTYMSIKEWMLDVLNSIKSASHCPPAFCSLENDVSADKTHQFHEGRVQ